MTPAKQLRGARMKLQRAEEHLGNLQAEHERFIRERNPYRMLREQDTERDYYLWRAKITDPPPLEKWGSIAGECIHSLRSALDHTAYELVRMRRPSEEKSEFPIFKKRSAWRANHGQKLPDVDRDVRRQVRWLQPYRREGAMDRLWVVHALDIIDKHRRLNLVSPSLLGAEWVSIGGEIEDVQSFYGPFEDGSVVARFKIPPGNPLMRMQTAFNFDIAFGPGEPLAGQPVMLTLEDLKTYVGFVIGRFDRFF
jgi:hypothetical protein